MGSSSRAWRDTKAAKSPWEGWTGSFGVPGRGTAELRAQVGAGAWVWQVCHGLGWDVGQKQRRFGLWGRRAAGSLSSRQEVGNRMSWTLLCLFSASQLPGCALCVCVSSEFSPPSLFSRWDCLSAASFPPLCASPVCLCSLSSLSALSVLLCHPVPAVCSLSSGSSVPLSLCLWSVCSVPLCPLSPHIPLLLCALFALQVSHFLLQSLSASPSPGPLVGEQLMVTQGVLWVMGCS